MPVVNLDLTEEETAALLSELDGIIDGDRYILSPHIKILKAIRSKITPGRCVTRCHRNRSATSSELGGLLAASAMG